MFGLFTKKVQRQPRRYQVPEGLAETVIGLMEAINNNHFSIRAKWMLWKLLEERCPEVKAGQWTLEQDGARVFVVERLPS